MAFQDSDIEGHPNVDKEFLIRSGFLSRNHVFIKSCRRFYQLTTREKWEERNHRIEQLGVEVTCNEVLLARHKLAQSVSSFLSS